MGISATVVEGWGTETDLVNPRVGTLRGLVGPPRWRYLCCLAARALLKGDTVDWQVFMRCALDRVLRSASASGRVEFSFGLTIRQ